MVGACTAETPVSPSPAVVVAPTEAASGLRDAGSATRTVRIPAEGDARKAIELPSIEEGATLRLTSNCATQATWRSSAPRVASVVDGLITGVGAGRARITETCAGVESSVHIRVTRVRFVFVPDPPTPATVRVDDEGFFRAVVHRAGRRERLTTGVGSSNRDVLRLQLQGDRYRWRAVGTGRAEIRVNNRGRRVLTHPVRVTRQGGGGGGGGGDWGEVRNLNCDATGISVTISGAVHAFRAVRSVMVRAYVDDRLLGNDNLGNIGAGQSKRFRVTGTDPFLNSGSGCSVQVSASEAAGQTTLRTPRAGVVMLP